MAGSASDTQTANEAENKLLESALKLFAEKGYEGTSIREIIEGAGVTRPVLYYYFENKEDLFSRLVESQFAQLAAKIEEVKRQPISCVERLKGIIQIEFELAETNPDALGLILQVFFSPPGQGPALDKEKLAHMRFRHIEDIMFEGLDKGEFSGGDGQSLALVFQGIMDMHVMAKSNRPETVLTSELAASLVEFFLAGAAHRDTPVTALVSPYNS